MFKRIFNQKPLRLFDVTMRDGLQSSSKIYTLPEKKELLLNIISNRRPHALEIGSLVSPKILPQMDNSLEMYTEAEMYNSLLTGNRNIDIYMLTPNFKSLQTAIDNNITNFSFITSVSNSFQTKNVNKNLSQTKSELEQMMESVNLLPTNNVKLYISCINECPISGLIDIDHIIQEILYYYYTYENISEICLSDTCGTLQFTEFKYIIDSLHKRQIEIDRFSLHLHDQPDNSINLKEIIKYATVNGINKFDVSYLPNIGGCTVTMKNPTGNLSYDFIRSNAYNH